MPGRCAIRLAALLQLIDGYAQAPAIGFRAEFRLDGALVRPEAKAEAFYAFVDLDPGTYRLDVTTRDFFPFSTELRVPMAQPLADGIVACTLYPGPLYPFAPWATLVRGLVSSQRKPRPGVAVEARYIGKSGQELSRRTRTWAGGAYDGRYALSLGRRLTGETEITLDFTAPDGTGNRRTARVAPGTTTIVDLDLD